LTDRDIAEVSRYERSDAYGELDRLVLDLASAMTATPADVPDQLRRALLDRLGPASFAEVAATIAWENHRARLNRALDVRPAGFNDGAVCALPAHRLEPTGAAAAGGA
jgi:alkylhydroperoxidase family enzyme